MSAVVADEAYSVFCDFPSNVEVVQITTIRCRAVARYAVRPCQAELVCWPAYVYDACEKVVVD